jgi:hypothetical protein
LHLPAAAHVGRTRRVSRPRALHLSHARTHVRTLHRKPKFDLDKIPGPWTHAKPILGNILECLRPDFHRKLLEWSNQYGGIYRLKFLWQDALIVTDPGALAAIMVRPGVPQGQHARTRARVCSRV